MNLEDIKTIAVIGSGDMGHGIAEIASLAGYQVILNDIKQEFLDKAMNSIKKSMEKLASKGKITQENKDDALSKLSTSLDLKEAVKDVQLIIEAVPEIMELKKEIFKKLDDFSPKESIIASNTSNMSITELAKSTKKPEKVVGLHFFNPVIIMKLVEVIKGKKTSDEVLDLMVEFGKKIKKVPVKVMKDSPGFIVNRVTAPVSILLGKILEEKVEEPAKFDVALKEKGVAMGPYELADFVGLDIMFHSLEYFKKTLGPDYEAPNWLKEKIKKNELGKKTGKGIYDWSRGRPDFTGVEPSDKIELEDVIAIQVNEATKLLEEGVAEKSRVIDKAIKNGSGNPFGVFGLAKGFGFENMVKRCEKLAELYNVKTFLPTKMLKENKIK